MTCVEIGELRAFLDGEVAGPERVRMEQHLARCATCREVLEGLRENAAFVASSLGTLAPAPSEVPALDWYGIRGRIESEKRCPVTRDLGVRRMFRNLFGFAGGTRVRMATGALAALLAVALLFTLSPVQTAASSFLSLFRVKKFVAITVDPNSMPNLASPSDLGNLSIVGESKSREASIPEAERVVGFKVRTPSSLPSGLQPNPRVILTPGQKVTFTPDIEKVRAYLASIGASDVKLPDNLDGAPITLQMPPTVSLLYLERGGADRTPDGVPRPLVGQKHLYLGMTRSPTMTVPDGIDVDVIRSELLKVPGLPPDVVQQLKAIDDWRNTAVVPVIKGTSRDVTVQGEKGLLITDLQGQATMVVWLKGDVVYALSGTVSEAEILAAANSLQ